jgi:hypothetical protein
LLAAARDAHIIAVWIHDEVFTKDTIAVEIEAVRQRALATAGKRVHVERAESTSSAREWLRLHGGKVATRLRVVTNRFRPEDGGDMAASHVVDLVHTELGLKKVPVLVYCSPQGLPFVRSLLKKRYVFATSDL